MSKELKNKDYINILKFYKMNIPKSKRLLKQQAENIFSINLKPLKNKLDYKRSYQSIQHFVI